MPISDPILASPSDSLQIAKIHVESTKNSEVTKIVNGTADLNEMVTVLAIMSRPFNRYLVIKDTDTNEIISYVDWVLPHTKEGEAELRTFKAAFKGPRPPEGMDIAINKEFGEKIDAMRKAILGDPARRHYRMVTQR